MAGFPSPQGGVVYLAEGGSETELMYKHGHELPEFAMYPLLDDPAALADLTDMYTRYLEVAARYGLVPLMGGLDYRASLDWAANLGISAAGLEEFQLRSIEFLRDVAKPFAAALPRVLVSGLVGPRGDAYDPATAVTVAEAEDYHSAQLATLRRAQVDLVQALTFNAIDEAIGVARAAAHANLPLSIAFMVDASGRLLTGPTLKEAIETVDREAGDARPDFYGINCSHPLEFGPALVDDGPWRERIRMLRPNASTAEKGALCTLGELDAGDPQQLGSEIAAFARELPNVDVFGGCCGTWTDHLDAIARRLRPEVVRF